MRNSSPLLPTRRFWQHGLLCLLLASSLFWLVAVAVRLTCRDVSPWVLCSVMYYATPGPLLFAAALLQAGGYQLARHARGAACWLLLALILPQCAGSDPGRYLGPGPVINVAEHASRDSSAAVQRISDALIASGQSADLTHDTAPNGPADVNVSKRYRLLFWNISHLDSGLPALAAEMRNSQADLIALVEAGRASDAQRVLWQQEFPEYELTFLGAEMLLLIKQGTAGEIRAHELPFNSRYREVQLTLQEQPLTLFLVDIYGRPTLSRRTQLQELAEAFPRWQQQPLLMAGDFNTPRDSLLFQPFQPYVHDAFDDVGSGYAPTWPLPAPVLTLDQVWGNGGIRFHSYQAGWSRLSDHRSLLVEFSVVSPAAVRANSAGRQPE